MDGKPVIPGMKLSKEKCDRVNAIERGKALAWVAKNIKVPLTEPLRKRGSRHLRNNIGPGKCFPSTFYKRINAGDRRGACEAIRWWIKDGGRYCRIRSNNCYGQISRRDQESALACGESTDKQNILLKNQRRPTRTDNTESCELAKPK